MKEKREKRKYLRIISLIFAALVILAALVGVYNAVKPLPSGVSFEGEVHRISEEDVEFLYDLTYINSSGNRDIEQEIFPRIFELVDNAEKIIIIDAFLFNDDYIGNNTLIPITKSLKNKLIAKKQNYPNITIIFITDEINNFYGSYVSDEINDLESKNISVIITDMTSLRDSNPFYSGFWRTYIQWFGTEGTGSLKHPLGNQNHNVTVRAFLKLLNTKANHRKVLVADNNGSLVTLLTSANPHEASSYHSNIAFLVKRKIWHDALASERAVALLSGTRFPETNLSDFNQYDRSFGEERLSVQLLTEGKIKRALIRDIDSMVAGESINLAMFYLSDRDIVKSLKNAAERGVRVQVVLDPNKDAFSREKNGIPNRQVGLELTRAGISVRWYETHGEQFHTKLIILNKEDRTIIYGGSANYTRRNLADLNLESVVRIESPLSSSLVSRVDSYFLRIWENKGANYTLDFDSYKDSSGFKVLVYRFQEFSGFSSF